MLINDDDELFYLSTLTLSGKTGFDDGRVKQYKGKLHYLQTKQSGMFSV